MITFYGDALKPPRLSIGSEAGEVVIDQLNCTITSNYKDDLTPREAVLISSMITYLAAGDMDVVKYLGTNKLNRHFDIIRKG